MATEGLTKLAAAIERQTVTDGAYETAVPALRLSRRSAPSDLLAFVYEPCLCVVAQGAKEVLLADETYRLDPAQSLLVSVDLPVGARVVETTPSRAYLSVRISLDPAVVGELLADSMTAPPPSPPARGLAVTPIEPPLLDAVTRLMTVLDSPQDIVPLAPLVLREITYRLLTGPQGARLRQIALAGAPAQRIARAIRWLKDHFVEPLRVESLAKRIGMSPSAFHLHFKGVTALSPLQYQKRLRLQEARRLMLGEGLDAAEAAFRVGYESPSQFSREYWRLFGAPPRQDVAALKGEALPATQATRHPALRAGNDDQQSPEVVAVVELGEAALGRGAAETREGAERHVLLVRGPPGRAGQPLSGARRAAESSPPRGVGRRSGRPPSVGRSSTSPTPEVARLSSHRT